MKIWDSMKDGDWNIYTITKIPYKETNCWEYCCKVVFIELDWEVFLYDDELEYFTESDLYDNAILFELI